MVQLPRYLLAFSVGVTLGGEWLGDFVPESFSADEANRRRRRGNTGAHKSRVGDRYLITTVPFEFHGESMGLGTPELLCAITLLAFMLVCAPKPVWKSDSKREVGYTAAAAILRLAALSEADKTVGKSSLSEAVAK